MFKGVKRPLDFEGWVLGLPFLCSYGIKLLFHGIEYFEDE
jgi:hypothetical protein